jgi:hypothetical protein
VGDNTSLQIDQFLNRFLGFLLSNRPLASKSISRGLVMFDCFCTQSGKFFAPVQIKLIAYFILLMMQDGGVESKICTKS